MEIELTDLGRATLARAAIERAMREANADAGRLRSEGHDTIAMVREAEAQGLKDALAAIDEHFPDRRAIGVPLVGRLAR